MDNQKYCNTCKKSFDSSSFYRVIKRKDYGLNADSQGISYFLKPCKTCNSCRFKALNNRLKQKALF
jgi:hypothetical protein